MSDTATEPSQEKIDTSDLDHRIGKLVGGGELLEPCTKMDIRRWVMGMDYPNPIHWDEDFARETRFGGLVAPQSMAVALDWGDGISPSLVGHIPNSHMLFGGEEWWFYGHVIRPGDQLFQRRWLHDYKHVNSKFAGPSLITRGDTVHRNQNGTIVAKQRGTSVRYLVAEAQKRRTDENAPPPAPVWTPAKLAEVARVRHDWILSGRDGVSPRFEEVEVGQRLPRRALGPHSIQTFASEWRAFPFTTWGAFKWVGVPGDPDAWVNDDSGFTMESDWEAGKIDPRLVDGLYSGPASGHTNTAAGSELGLPRSYGYGASMNAWATDYLAYWAGYDGMVRHSKMTFRTPAYEGDVTYVDGEVIEKQFESSWGVPLITIKLTMTNQDGVVVVDGFAEVEVPL